MKKIVVASVAATLLFGTGVYAEDELQYGQEIEIQTDDGNYKVTIDKIVESSQFDYYEGENIKVVCVDCIVENIDYKNYANVLNTNDIGTGEISLLDADGISSEFYNVQMSSNDGYGFYVDIKPGEKKKVALPFFVAEDTNSVTLKINSQYEITQILNEENNKEQESTQSGEESELKKQIETLESENSKLKSENEDLKKENEDLKNSMNEKSENETEEVTEVNQNIQDTEQTSEVEYTDATTIRIVQQTLNELGYNCGSPDGVAGGKTTEAVKNYQTDKNITVNGKITDELLDTLDISEKVQAAIEAEASKSEYGSDYTYDQLARNPDSYKEKKVLIKGKVLQAETSDTVCYARVAMNSDYNTVIFVTYDSSLLGYRLLEDDIITVYGIAQGVYSYEAVSGATITIPWINADIIEM